jgi:hypothetical protein
MLGRRDAVSEGEGVERKRRKYRYLCANNPLFHPKNKSQKSVNKLLGFSLTALCFSPFLSSTVYCPLSISLSKGEYVNLSGGGVET